MQQNGTKKNSHKCLLGNAVYVVSGSRRFLRIAMARVEKMGYHWTSTCSGSTPDL